MSLATNDLTEPWSTDVVTGGVDAVGGSSMDLARLEREVEEALRQGAACLTGPPWLNSDGGIGRDPTKQSDLWSTAEALILACRLDKTSAVAASAVKQMKEYVLASQHPDGGWASDESESDVVGTTLALMALRHWSEDTIVIAAAENGVAWLARNQNNDGGWDVTASVQHTSRVSTAYPTIHAYEAIRVWFLDNVGPIALVQQALNNARVWLTNARQGSGIRESTKASTPSVRHTAYAILADRSAGELDLPREAIARWLEQQQHRNGTWGGPGATDNVESTAAALRAQLMLGAPPQGRRARAAIESLLEQRSEQTIAGQHYSGWPTREGGPPTSWPTYYSLMAFYDYLEVLRTQSRKRTVVYFPLWRKVTASSLFFVLIAGILATLVVAGSNRTFAAALTTLVAVANVIVAIPLLSKWLRNLRSG